MSGTVQIIGAAGGCVLPLLCLATYYGAAVGRYEADCQDAAQRARFDEQRAAARERVRPRPSWPAEYPPLLPTTVPVRPLPDATARTAVRPGPPGPGRHRKEKTAC
ncbi:hypothetical protein [Streptomyces tauricus]